MSVFFINKYSVYLNARHYSRCSSHWSLHSGHGMEGENKVWHLRAWQYLIILPLFWTPAVPSVNHSFCVAWGWRPLYICPLWSPLGTWPCFTHCWTVNSSQPNTYSHASWLNVCGRKEGRREISYGLLPETSYLLKEELTFQWLVIPFELSTSQVPYVYTVRKPNWNELTF